MNPGGLSPPGHPLAKLGLTVAIAALGGGAAAAANLPLAWLIGAMVAVTIAAVAGAPVAMPSWVRAPTLAVLGVFLGSSFTPDVLGNISDWWKVAVLVPLYVCAVAVLAYRVLLWWGYDRTTALYASPPGGLSEMLMLGGEAGGDTRAIVLVHATRILVAVTIAPFLITLLTGIDLGQTTNPRTSNQNGFGLGDAFVLVGCGVAGLMLGRILRLPAAPVMGPMLVSALAHGLGLTQATPPGLAIAAAQILIGANVGTRFSTKGGWRAVKTPILLGAGIGLTMTIVSGLFAYLAAPIVDIDPIPLFLALAPGGFSEMMLVALVIGADTAFVAAMHVLRIATIVIAIPIFYYRSG